MFINILITAYIYQLISIPSEIFRTNSNEKYTKCEGTAIPVTDRRGLYGCETERLPYFLDNRLTDGCEAVSLM
jgi:hypothetical protein